MSKTSSGTLAFYGPNQRYQVYLLLRACIRIGHSLPEAVSIIGATTNADDMVKFAGFAETFESQVQEQVSLGAALITTMRVQSAAERLLLKMLNGGSVRLDMDTLGDLIELMRLELVTAK